MSDDRLAEEVTFLEQDIETIVDAVAKALGIDGGDIDGDGDQGGIIARFIGDIARQRDDARAELVAVRAALDEAQKENARLSEDWEEVVELRGRLVESTRAYDEVRAALAAAVKANETVVAVRAALADYYNDTQNPDVQRRVRALLHESNGCGPRTNAYGLRFSTAGVLASACICVRGSDGPDESCPVHGRAGSTPEADA